MTTMLEAMLEATEEPKLARGIKGVEAALRKAGFDIWEQPRSSYNHRGQRMPSAAMVPVGKLQVVRYAGYDFLVRAGLGSGNFVDEKSREKANGILLKAKEAMEELGYQVEQPKNHSLSFSVKGKMPS